MLPDNTQGLGTETGTETSRSSGEADPASELNAPQAIYLEDYQAPPYFIDNTDLVFELAPSQTLVECTLKLRRNADHEASVPLVLHGDASLQMISLALNGEPLKEAAYTVGPDSLTLANPPAQFTLTIRNQINPEANTSLEGLYLSNGMFCTQCEAEGFRKITYYLDRPDVMSRFTTKIIADKSQYPVLLSNGNPVDSGDLDEGRHWIQWEDPFKKPCYLFALVGGDLACATSSFTTCSGREIRLELYVESHDLDKCDYALGALQRSMKWDEEVYGREYDLDIYMIVAVSHFNMGAMENKGLNIFNSSCVLAKPETTVDSAFQRIEAIIAHEYFHNWSGNRVTCRDWFQLSLKEGFTVFRDQSFSADLHSDVVHRIEQVNFLKTVQFAEDAGPMAHQVRPDSFIEINNFYTVTIYEKGAEVVRMLHTLLGPELFRKGSDAYFEQHDGEAVTIDDFVAAMESVSGRNLDQFKRWYTQAGTPVLNITDEYDEATQQYCLNVEQVLPEAAKRHAEQSQLDQSENKIPKRELGAYVVPLRLGLLDAQGADLANETLCVDQMKQSFKFDQVAQRPIPSIGRGFSAPVHWRYEYDETDLYLLMQHDTDGFNRWNACQKLAINHINAIVEQMLSAVGGPSASSVPVADVVVDPRFIDAYRGLLRDQESDPAMLAVMLELPTEAYLSSLSEPVQVDALHHARNRFKSALLQALQEDFSARYQALRTDGPFELSGEAMAQRRLKNLCLSYLCADSGEEALILCQQQFETANNMTDESSAFRLLVHSDDDSLRDGAIERFYGRWQQEALVVDQWLSVQATRPQSDVLQSVRGLMDHPDFSMTNPNKVRALIAAFCNSNSVNFHRADGEGYVFLKTQIASLNEINPQIASRLLVPLTRWKRYDAQRQGLMKAQLEALAAITDLSPDVYEVVSKSLADT